VNAGGLTLASDAGANVSIVASAPVSLLTTEHLAGLTLSAGTTATIASGGGKVLVVGALALNVGSSLDVADNSLIVHSTLANQSVDLAAITGLLASGYGANSSIWSGTGLRSSAAATNASRLTALGVLLNGSAYTTFGGQSVSPTDILVKYTYFGDADLSGVIDGADYARLDNGFNNSLSRWGNGDFTYGGNAASIDYAIIDNTYNLQGTPLGNTALLPLKADVSAGP
jgi:hypothetical protein